MKTRICVVGDSHAASLKRAWRGMAGLHDSFELRFFCARGLELSGMIVDELRLVPNSDALAQAIKFTAEGCSHIDPKNYDVFLLYGLGCYPHFEQQTDVFHSRHVLAAALRDSAKSTLSFQLLLRLREITARDIYVGHRPLDAAKSDTPTEEAGSYATSIRRMNEILYQPLRATIVSQPLETMVGGRFTQPHFSRGSRRLAIGDNLDDELHPDDDDVHMNDDYGLRWLAKFLTGELAGQRS
jgi:hypothetical protein